jgi:adenylate cyclase
VATIRVAGREEAVPASPARTILVALQQAGVPIETRCGGRAMCGRCAIRVTSGRELLSAPRRSELERLREIGAPEGSRLACQTFTRGEVGIEVVNATSRSPWDPTQPAPDPRGAP